MTVMRFATVDDYWNSMVIPDFDEFQADRANLRKAFHLATSLFHMADWIWVENEAAISATFTFTEGNKIKPVKKAQQFANSLADISDDFTLIRHVANAGKHMELDHSRPNVPPQAPMYSANVGTYMVVKEVTSGAWGDQPYASGPWGGGAQSVAHEVKLEGPADLLFFNIAENVRDFWLTLRAQHNW